MLVRRLLCAAALLSASLAAHAFPITYTETATATGSLNGVTFTNAFISFTGTGDTTGVADYAAGYSVYNRVPISLTIAGLGSTTLSSVDVFYANTAGYIGIVNPSAPGPVLELISGNGSYDLRTFLSPVTGSSYLGASTATASGNFFLTSASNITFQAAAPLAATPEPSSLPLLGTGMLGVLGVVRKRFV